MNPLSHRTVHLVTVPAASLPGLMTSPPSCSSTAGWKYSVKLEQYETTDASFPDSLYKEYQIVYCLCTRHWRLDSFLLMLHILDFVKVLIRLTVYYDLICNSSCSSSGTITTWWTLFCFASMSVSMMSAPQSKPPHVHTPQFNPLMISSGQYVGAPSGSEGHSWQNDWWPVKYDIMPVGSFFPAPRQWGQRRLLMTSSGFSEAVASTAALRHFSGQRQPSTTVCRLLTYSSGKHGVQQLLQ